MSTKQTPMAPLKFALAGQIVSTSRAANLIAIHANVHGEAWLVPQAESVRNLLLASEKAGAA